MPDSLKLADFLDEEVLALIVDLGDNEGWVSSAEFAEIVQLPIMNVGSRLSWLRRYGVLERDLQPGSPTFRHWRLTNLGLAVVKASYSKSQQKAIESLAEDQLFLAMQSFASQFEMARGPVANLVRRRFNASVMRRRRVP